MQMLRCFRPAQMKPYLAKKEFFLHLPIMFNVKAKTNFVSLAIQDYMIATKLLGLKLTIFSPANI